MLWKRYEATEVILRHALHVSSNIFGQPVVTTTK